MTLAFAQICALVAATWSPAVETEDCRENRPCETLRRTKVTASEVHRSLFAEAVRAYLLTNLNRPAESRDLPDPVHPGDPIYVVASVTVPLAFGDRISVLPNLAAAESIAKEKGRSVVVTEFELTQASRHSDGHAAVEVIVSSGRVVQQPPAANGQVQWRYVSDGFAAFHIYRREGRKLVFRLEARAAI